MDRRGFVVMYIAILLACLQHWMREWILGGQWTVLLDSSPRLKIMGTGIVNFPYLEEDYKFVDAAMMGMEVVMVTLSRCM